MWWIQSALAIPDGQTLENFPHPVPTLPKITLVIPDPTKIPPRNPSGIARIRYNEVRYSEGRL